MGNPAGVRRDFDALEKRRFEAIRLVEQGVNQLEVARRLKIARQTISRWMTQYRSEGKSALKKAGRAGRKPRLTSADRERLEKLLVQGPEAVGYETPLWTCPRVADLIQALVRHVASPLLLVWDGLPAHRSRLVRDFLQSLDGWIEWEYLPAYAPELNPVEYIWAYWKQHELPNVCPKDYWQLGEAARRTLRRMRRRPRIIRAFWKQAQLRFD